MRENLQRADRYLIGKNVSALYQDKAPQIFVHGIVIHDAILYLNTILSMGDKEATV